MEAGAQCIFGIDRGSGCPGGLDVCRVIGSVPEEHNSGSATSREGSRHENLGLSRGRNSDQFVGVYLGGHVPSSQLSSVFLLSCGPCACCARRLTIDEDCMSGLISSDSLTLSP